MPDGAVIADESVTFGRGFFPLTKAAPPHDWLNVTGGAIGGPPLATASRFALPVQFESARMRSMSRLDDDDRDDGDDDARSRTNVIVLGVALALLGIAILLLYEYRRSTDELDCFAASHRDCAPVDQSQ